VRQDNLSRQSSSRVMYNIHVEVVIVSGSAYEWEQKGAVEGIAEFVSQQILFPKKKSSK
jgi:hypothetical protein